MKRASLKLLALAVLASIVSAGGIVHDAAGAAAGPGLSRPSGDAQTVPELERRVRDFLANVPENDRKIFDDFFADDVIYTRSAGVTVAKADIIRNIGVRAAREPEATFDADDFTIHPYGNFAVVNFRLIMHNTTAKDRVTATFRNTGTFIKRSGKWQAVAWQSTKVPEAAGKERK